MKPRRIVIDVNLLVSLLIGKRVAGLLEGLAGHGFQVVVHDELLGELDDVARRTKFRKYFPTEVVDALLELLRRDGFMVEGPLVIEPISRDPDDDYLLALSKAAKAHVLLTGDDDLLVLKKHGSTRIMTARAFVEEYLK